MWFQIVKIEIETNVAVELAVTRVARIASLPAPDLRGRIGVATERGEAGRRDERSKNSKPRLRTRVQNSMGVNNEPADVGLLQNRFHPLRVSAFRQPDAARVPAEAILVMVAGHKDLRANGRRMIGQQRQERVRGSAGDDFQLTQVLKFAKCSYEVTVAGKVKLPQLTESVEVEQGQLVKRLFPMRPLDFFLGQFD